MDISAKAAEYFARKDILEQAIEDLREIVAIPSVAAEGSDGFPYGAECAKAIDKAEELAKKYGFRFENHGYSCASIIFGDKEREVGIVTHLDVVPAGEGWETDPFSLDVRDGLLVGRGAHDDKGPFIQSLYTLRFLKENNITLPFSVRLIVGSGEEVGCNDLDYFSSPGKAPEFSFTPDSEYPVCIGEKGLLSVDIDLGEVPSCISEISGGTVSNAVPFFASATLKGDFEIAAKEGITAEKTKNGVTVTAAGLAAHAAMPEKGKNAIGSLACCLLENNLPLSPKDKQKLEFLASACGEYLGKRLGIAGSNKDFGYLTCIGGVLSTVNGRMIQNFNIRYLPEESADSVADRIRTAVRPMGYSVKVLSASEGYFVSADDKRIQALTRACESVLNIPCEPYTMGGGTYARALPNTVAFGAAIPSERNYLGDSRGGPHQRDEYISMKEFVDGMNIFVRSLSNLSEVF